MSRAITVDELKKQLEATEKESEQLKAYVYRCDGIIIMLKHLIADVEKEEVPPADATLAEAEPLKE